MDKYDIPASAIPPGHVYQWVRASIAGSPDPVNLERAKDAGWRPVPWDRHPDLFSDAANVGGEVQVMGLVLMERTAEQDRIDRDDIRAGEVMLNGMGCHRQQSPSSNAAIERLRLWYQDMNWRRKNREVIRMLAEERCRGLFAPETLLQVEEPRGRVIGGPVPMRVWMQDASRSVEAWRVFEPAAIEHLRQVESVLSSK